MAHEFRVAEAGLVAGELDAAAVAVGYLALMAVGLWALGDAGDLA